MEVSREYRVERENFIRGDRSRPDLTKRDRTRFWSDQGLSS